MSHDPQHWMHFYQLGSAAESTASASSSPPVTHANPSAGGSGSGSASLNPEGGVTKPARRRTRASRRTPTTVMNTDTTNFRAMVQQFTGGPTSTAFSSGPGTNMLSFEFGQGQGQGPDSRIGQVQVQYSHPHQYQPQQYNNLLSLNTTNDTSRSRQVGEGENRLRFSLEGIGIDPRVSGSMTSVEGIYPLRVPRRSASSDDNRVVNNNNNNNDEDYIF